MKKNLIKKIVQNIDKLVLKDNKKNNCNNIVIDAKESELYKLERKVLDQEEQNTKINVIVLYRKNMIR